MRSLHTFRLPSGVVCACLLAAALHAQAAPPKAPHPHVKREVYKQQVEKLEQDWRTAQLSADVASMDKLLSDDYVGISMTGQVMTKTEQLNRLRDRQLSLTKIDLDDVKVKMIGTTAIVTSQASIEGTNDGQSVRGLYRYTRVYSRLPSGTWKITNFEATRVGPFRPPPGDKPNGDRPPRDHLHE